MMTAPLSRRSLQFQYAIATEYISHLRCGHNTAQRKTPEESNTETALLFTIHLTRMRSAQNVLFIGAVNCFLKSKTLCLILWVCEQRPPAKSNENGTFRDRNKQT